MVYFIRKLESNIFYIFIKETYRWNSDTATPSQKLFSTNYLCTYILYIYIKNLEALASIYVGRRYVISISPYPSTPAMPRNCCSRYSNFEKRPFCVAAGFARGSMSTIRRALSNEWPATASSALSKTTLTGTTTLTSTYSRQRQRRGGKPDCVT